MLATRLSWKFRPRFHPPLKCPQKYPCGNAVWAYFINAICYFPVALIGYWSFGQDVADNVLVALERPLWLIAAANLMVVIHVIGSYQPSHFSLGSPSLSLVIFLVSLADLVLLQLLIFSLASYG
ncbi:Lysine histidine transporter-like 6 [Camellia lanceoleosa]|uniref:Lysine histidine transporter-like 6 n=1 Tax=Camellia lanceoleosa TaxID=1840588 RepID=A0ACC0GBD7_9ERIC|nr:Lysine histidine transporter-like 6 [Camellia lanceoleosa]